MCCLFGMIDYGNKWTGKQKSRMLNILATECEARGTDASGISYNHRGRTVIYKRAKAAHKMRFKVMTDTMAVMGHTRLTTQGNEKLNYNNHPFPGKVDGHRFALAHNGVLGNDKELRVQHSLPQTYIETDSYIAVQLIEKENTLNFKSLKNMAEQVDGTFCFTVLADDNRVFFVKGNNPLNIYRFPDTGLILYASTLEILAKALHKIPYSLGKAEQIKIEDGDIIMIDGHGNTEKDTFNEMALYRYAYPYSTGKYKQTVLPYYADLDDDLYDIEYLEELKTAAAYYGIDREQIDKMIAEGFTIFEIEEMLFFGEW